MAAIVIAATPAERAATSAELAQRAIEQLSAAQPDLVVRVDHDDAPTRDFIRAHAALYVPLADLEATERALAKRLADAKRDANPLFIQLDKEPPDTKELDALRAKAPRRRGRARPIDLRQQGWPRAGHGDRDRVSRDRCRGRPQVARCARSDACRPARAPSRGHDRVRRRRDADAGRARLAAPGHARVVARDRGAGRARAVDPPALAPGAGDALGEHPVRHDRRVRRGRDHRRAPQRGDRVPRRDHRGQRRQLRDPARRAVPRAPRRARGRRGDGARDRGHGAADARRVARRGDRVRRARRHPLQGVHRLRDHRRRRHARVLDRVVRAVAGAGDAVRRRRAEIDARLGVRPRGGARVRRAPAVGRVRRRRCAGAGRGRAGRALHRERSCSSTT